MTQPQGRRIAWTQVPERVRHDVARILGAPVVEATSQPGGFSPGVADRVVTAAGRRAFVKAVGRDINPRSADLHRREVQVTPLLAASDHVPAVLGSYDDGDWVAIVLEDVEGVPPRTPWVAAELQAVLAALDDLRSASGGLDLLGSTSVAYAGAFAGWERLGEDPPEELDPWIAAHLDRLTAAAAGAAGAVRGDALVHGDLRADNILLSPDGTVWFVDWPEATRGASWFDTLCLLVNVQLYGGHDVERLVRHHVPAAPADVDDVLAGLAGYFVDAARQPAPAGLPTVRAFQAAQGARTLEWLRRRWAAGRT